MKRLSLISILIFLTGAVASATNPLVFGKTRITIVTPTLIRAEYALDGRFIDEPSMFAYDRSSLLDQSEFSVEKTGTDRYTIRTSALRIEYWDNGYPIGESNLVIHYRKEGKDRKFTNRGIYNENLGASVPTLDKLSGPVPLSDGLFSRSGWYIVDDEGKDLLCDGWLKARNTPDHIQDQYYFVYGDDYKAALRDLGAISGKVPMTRRYVHGVWFSRYWDYTGRDLLGIVDEYDAHDFPLDNVVVDMAWHENDATTGIGGSGKLFWTGYDWNSKLFPDPAAFASAMHQKGIHIALNDHPHDGIRPSESCYDSFMGSLGVAKDSLLLFSPHDKDYMTSFFRFAHDPSTAMGVDFWWLDWQQNHIFPKVRGCQSTTLQWLNELYWRNSSKNGLRGCTFSRWAGWGDHRHPVQFSGDAHITWPMLRFEIKLSSYGSGDGCYYWVHDIGGFKGEPDPELNVRWTQFGALSAALRIHSTKSASLDRRPWLGSETETQALRKAYRLRAALMPYVYSSVHQVSQSMVPLNRPLFVEYPLCPQAFECEQEYLFGDLLLCAPICTPGQGENKVAQREVWFPEGEVWCDFFSGERIAGGQTLQVSKPLDEFPLYLKSGWMLPMQEICPRPSLASPQTIRLLVYASDGDCDNSYELYEDDGVSMEYLDGRCCKTELRYIQKGDFARFLINSDNGSYSGKPASRDYVIEFHRKDGSVVEVKASKAPSAEKWNAVVRRP